MKDDEYPPERIAEIRQMYEFAMSHNPAIPSGADSTQRITALQAARRIEEKYLAGLGRIVPNLLDEIERLNVESARRLALLREVADHPDVLWGMVDSTIDLHERVVSEGGP